MGQPEPVLEDESSRYTAGELIAQRYRLVHLLGRGGVGEVWAAEHVHLKSRVAIKFFVEDPTTAHEGAEAALERFRFEAQVSAQLAAKTPHIVTVHDAGLEERGPYLVMELVDGRPLASVIDEDGPSSIARALEILEPIGDALTKAHEAGIVHRDLKPSNILVIAGEDRETAKLADFGIAKGLSTSLAVDAPKQTAFGLVIGTPDYMSPEQVTGETVTTLVDLWALAVLVYEVITGVIPFAAPSHHETMLAVALKPLTKVSVLRPDLSPKLDAWFDRALHKDPRQRYRSTREMFNALRALAGMPRMASMVSMPSIPVPEAVPISNAPPPRRSSVPPQEPPRHRPEPTTRPTYASVTPAAMTSQPPIGPARSSAKTISIVALGGAAVAGVLLLLLTRLNEGPVSTVSATQGPSTASDVSTAQRSTAPPIAIKTALPLSAEPPASATSTSTATGSGSEKSGPVRPRPRPRPQSSDPSSVY